jgi:hypothetical protein
LKDSRHDFHIWLSASALSKALGKIDQQAAK